MREGERQPTSPAGLTEALAELLRLHETGAAPPAPAVDEFIAARPALAPHLRQAYEDWRRAGAWHEAASTPATWGLVLQRLAAHAPKVSRYEIRGRIARGGMGDVLEVWDDDLRRRLAMKTIRDDLAADRDRVLGRFLEEAQVTAQLDHPGIVPVHEMGLDASGRLYFTMQLVKGLDLAQVFTRLRAGTDDWNVTRAVGVLLKVCEAMAFAHSRAVIHRDLKPGNIMVGRFGEVFVMDWGLARVLGAPDRKDIRPRRELAESTQVHSERSDRRDADSPLVTMDGDVLGTPAYMAPEQASGEIQAVGPAADVYSVGAILYELLAGAAPHVQPDEHISPQALLVRVQALAPEPLARRAAHAPAELVAICERAMARTPGDRYPSMADLAADLRAYLENRVVRAHAVGPWVELKKWVARNRAAALALAGLVVVTLGAAGAVAWVESRRAEEVRLTALVQRAQELVQRANRLGSIEPAAAPAKEQWLREVDRLLAEAEPYLEEAAALGSDPGFGAAAAAGSTPTPDLDELRHLRERLQRWEAIVARAPDAGTPERRDYEAQRQRTIAGEFPDLRARVRSLELSLPPAWALDSHADRSRRARLADLLRATVALQPRNEPLLAGRGLADMVRRELAAAAALGCAVDGAAWERAAATVAATPCYRGLALQLQAGLVPLGADPASGLQEFWHVVSGERPARDTTGQIVLDERSGIVLVLLPGGTFTIGAQARSRDEPNYDPESHGSEQPPCAVTLDPFLIGKFEITQAQWVRLMGHNPSAAFAGANYSDRTVVTRLHPVEHLTWFEAARFVARLGLDLPTEAQFEYALRAGSTSRFWNGDDPARLMAKVPAGSVHSPVDAGEPNPFGLWCMAGNVAEWCRDPYAERYAQVQFAPGDGAMDSPLSSDRASRGGAAGWRPIDLRSARRLRADPDDAAAHRGLRAVRRLQGFSAAGRGEGR